MVARMWCGSTKHEDADRYVDYLRETGVREYRATTGNRGVYVLRRQVQDRTEFRLISLWDSMDAIRGFAGDDVEKAVFYPEDDAFLMSREEHVRHFEVVEGP